MFCVHEMLIICIKSIRLDPLFYTVTEMLNVFFVFKFLCIILCKNIKDTSRFKIKDYTFCKNNGETHFEPLG